MSERFLTHHLNDSVTLHMRRDFARIEAGRTVGEALEALHRQAPGGRIVYFYVIDGENRLQGVLPARRLLLSPPETPVSAITVREVVALPETATVEEACDFFILHRLLAFPVVDVAGRIVGVVDVELYTEELGELERHEHFDDLFQLIGIHLTEAQQASLLRAFRYRFPWLLCNIIGGIAAALLAGFFEAELQRLTALALFMPVVLALSESVSVQSVSLTLQFLRGRPPTLRSLAGRIRSEMARALLLGLVSGVVVAFLAQSFWGQQELTVCLLLGIALGMTAAAGLGVLLPTLLRLMRRDPHVAAGPVVLAVSDLLTLLVYFSLAKWF
ncbi:MAG: magnesium transporter [Pirellulales bacterium]|nr:magnesium transporter [Pirellulales bacterium]